MRYTFAAIVPFVAAVYAQESSISSAATTASTPSYSNPNTAFLTQTDSRGVVTGQPANTAVAETAQPAVATIPAGLPAGLHTLAYGNMTSFTVSVGGTTTTNVIGAGAGAPTGVTTGSGPQATPVEGDDSNNDSNNDSDDASESGSSGTAGSDSASATSEGAGALATAATGLIGMGLIALAL